MHLIIMAISNKMGKFTIRNGQFYPENSRKTLTVDADILIVVIQFSPRITPPYFYFCYS
jgi:hypothetical protein